MRDVKSIVTRVALFIACAPSLTVPSLIVRAADLNDYPTSARVDYVFACMKANGETQVSLQKCSCSIDVIASLLSYDRYVAAQTVLSISQGRGILGAEFRSPELPRAALDDLRPPQAEAEVLCFKGEPLSRRLNRPSRTPGLSSTASERNMLAPFN